MQLREVPLHPLGQAAVVAALVGDNQRLIPQVGGAERPPRDKHTPGTARQAVGPRTKPIRKKD